MPVQFLLTVTLFTASMRTTALATGNNPQRMAGNASKLGSSNSIGIVAAIAGAATMGLGTVLVKRWKRPVPLLVFTAWQLTVGGIVLLPIALVIEGPITQSLNN